MMETITVHATFGKAILQEIAINRLHSGTYQPRDIFSEESLERLSKTIAQLGVLEPLIVRLSSRNTDQFGYPFKLTLNKNETGCFRIHFHDREHMQKILDKLGYSSEESLAD
jgi:hypothetical protein